MPSERLKGILTETVGLTGVVREGYWVLAGRHLLSYCRPEILLGMLPKQGLFLGDRLCGLQRC